MLSVIRRCSLLGATGLLVACGGTTSPPSPADGSGGPPQITARAETDPTAEDGANAAVVWITPDHAENSLVIAAGGTGGLEVYGLDGKRRQRLDEGAFTQVALLPEFRHGETSMPLVVAFAYYPASVLFYTIDADRNVTRLGGGSLAVNDEATGLCVFRSPITGKTYALVITDEGMLQQWEIFHGGGDVQGRQVRTVPVGKGAESCIADDEAGLVYFTDETLGVFAIEGDPEAETERRAVDVVAPFGSLGEPKGIALHRQADGSTVLAVTDARTGTLALYSGDAKRLGAVRIAAGAGVDEVTETEGIALTAQPLGERFPQGVLVVSDEDNEGEHSNFKLVSWADVVKAAGLPALTASPAKAGPAAVAKTVHPTLETAPAASFGDAADDPAIWVHPTNPARSAVIATDKQRGLYVYDLQGRLLQDLPDGRMNNVDLRDGFQFADGAGTLVTASNRTNKSIAIYRLDAGTRKLENRAAAVVPTGFADPYGLCMYRSARSGDVYVFVNDSDDGRFRQWKLTPSGRNVTAEMVREFVVGTQAEGCAADDELGALYIAEEDVALWKYSAEPDGGDTRTEVDRIGGPNPLVADLEGVSIWQGANGRGYLVLSNQGANNYAVYRRKGNNEFVGTFHVVADPARGIDGSSETDGLDVVSAPLGPQFPEGLLVVQDGRNITPAERQNFKYVSWREIAKALALEK
jgi:3-phytase